MSDGKLKKKIEQVSDTWERHHHIKVGDVGIYTTESGQKIDVRVFSETALDDGSPRWHVVDSKDWRYIVRPDQLSIDPMCPIFRLLTDDLSSTIQLGAYKVVYSLPRIMSALMSFDPVTATQSQYSHMDDWLGVLDSLMKDHPILKASPFVGNVREAIRLWLVRAIDHKFQDRQGE